MNGLLIGTEEMTTDLKSRIPQIVDTDFAVVSIPYVLTNASHIIEAASHPVVLSPGRNGSPALHVAPDDAKCATVLQQISPADRQRQSGRLMVQDDSIDCVIMSEAICMLHREQWERLLGEVFRVLRKDGAVWFDLLLADEPINPHHPRVINDRLVTYIPQELQAIEAIVTTGFHGLEIVVRETEPAGAIGAVEISRYTMRAFKGKLGPCFDYGHAVIYMGPWRGVHDDDGHYYERGVRTAVCGKTYALLMRAPYAGQFVGMVPLFPLPEGKAPPFDCNTPAVRDPRVSKGMKTLRGSGNDACCATGGGCC